MGLWLDSSLGGMLVLILYNNTIHFFVENWVRDLFFIKKVTWPETKVGMICHSALFSMVTQRGIDAQRPEKRNGWGELCLFGFDTDLQQFKLFVFFYFYNVLSQKIGL